ncbi:unnamed protein product [Linum trigynum]|uniref:Uncharacterized protein n=1 Tax=Linum trigynum TaxID=586398 RepID=A0AAV2EKV8_9ROSI
MMLARNGSAYVSAIGLEGSITKDVIMQIVHVEGGFVFVIVLNCVGAAKPINKNQSSLSIYSQDTLFILKNIFFD